MAEIRALAARLGLNPDDVAGRLSHEQLVRAAGEATEYSADLSARRSGCGRSYTRATARLIAVLPPTMASAPRTACTAAALAPASGANIPWFSSAGPDRASRPTATLTASLRQRPEVGALVGEHATIGARAAGHEARAGRHLGVAIPFRITSAVEADGGPHHPREQVEANKLPFLQAPADGEVIPARGVTDVLERVLVLVGPEVMDVAEGGRRAQHRPRRRGPVVVGAVVVLDTDTAENRVEVVGDIAGRVDVRRAGPAQLVDKNPVVLRDR